MSRITRDILENAKTALRLDEVSGSLTYVGEAEISSLDSQARWIIKRLLKTGTVTLVEWADGNDLPDNIWANRASLTYV